MILPTPREPVRHEADLAADLAPVRDALHRLARETAAERLAEADRQAAAVLAQAEQEVAQARAQVRAQALAEGALLVEEARRHARKRARSFELEARRRAYERLRARSRTAVREAVAADAQVLAAVQSLAREWCGPGAEVSMLPGGGGVTARAGDRQVTCAFDALTDQEVDRLVAGRSDLGPEP